ncbi:MAG: hypothetical protein EB127_15615 [Alphaproteobacteria bacterium]|nr:hypothetical protein [Alphaproteobacteria bacterium]
MPASLPAGARLIANRKNLSATLHFTANATITIAGNSSVSHIATGDEVISGAYITQVWHGSMAQWIVKRGANTVGVFDSTAYNDFAGNGNSLVLDPSATLVVSLDPSVTSGYLMIELQKIGPFAPDAYFQN